MALADSGRSLPLWRQLDCLTPAPRTGPPCAELRIETRSAFPYRMLLEPIRLGRTVGYSGPIEVVGVNISPSGFCFLHAAPIPFRHVLLRAADPRLEELGLGDLQFSLVMKWRRFIGTGQYELGGRIIWPQADVA